MSRPGAALILLLAWGTVQAGGDLVVRGDVVHTMAGEPIRDGVVIVRDGKVDFVGPRKQARTPEGLPVLEAAVVTPGLIDAHTVVGLAGYLNQKHDQDQLERSEAIQPELRAIDAYNAREELVKWVRSFGVTTIHTGHGPGAVISGQTMIAKTRGDTLDEAILVPFAMVAATLGEGARNPNASEGKIPGTRSKAAAILRGKLIEAQEYRRKREAEDSQKRPDRDLRLESLLPVLDGEVPLLVTVHRHNDILTALRIREEFGLSMVLDGAAESYLVIDPIRDAGVPVFIHPTMTRAYRDRENLSMGTAATLVREDIPMAFASGYESYVPKTRVVLFEAAVAVAYGLAFQDALASLTSESARLLGIDDRVGTLEVGKDGDLALYDGDPFEYTSHCVGVIIEGEVVSGEPR